MSGASLAPPTSPTDLAEHMLPDKLDEFADRPTIASKTLSGRDLDVRTGPEVGRSSFDRQTQFLQLFLMHERRIRGFILTLVPAWSDADDLLQETSAVMWRKLDEFEVGTDFAAWALCIARYQVLNYRKKQRRDRAVFSDETVEALADRMASVGTRPSNDSRDALEQCLTKLRSGDDDLIRWRYQPGATTQEVAHQSGRSTRAVYKALNRIHGQLLDCIRRSLASGGLS